MASLEPIAKDKNANIRLAIVGTLGLICGVSFTIFLFLIPFQIDPAAAALVADFVPSTCSVVNASMALGLSQCHWSSCAEGCTRKESSSSPRIESYIRL